MDVFRARRFADCKAGVRFDQATPRRLEAIRCLYKRDSERMLLITSSPPAGLRRRSRASIPNGRPTPIERCPGSLSTGAAARFTHRHLAICGGCTPSTGIAAKAHKISSLLAAMPTTDVRGVRSFLSPLTGLYSRGGPGDGVGIRRAAGLPCRGSGQLQVRGALWRSCRASNSVPYATRARRCRRVVNHGTRSRLGRPVERISARACSRRCSGL